MGLSELFIFLTRITWLSGLAFALGFILLIVEMFIPDFGVAGISGLILLFVGFLSISKSLTDAMIVLLILILLFALVLFILYRSGVKGKLSKTVVLNDKLDKESGFSGTQDLSRFEGMIGEATSVLRPSGTAEFDSVKLDVVTQGGYIEKGTQIKVIKVEGSRVIVVEEPRA
ncbi:MAG: NfeD family protein [Eubacteriales bacterium]|nr:NfeD family protein [Eubacteriales bacterium]